MGRDYYYKAGSYYRIDDRSGFRFRAERTKKQWDNLIVAERFWEIRQPQDFVRGVRDDQTVPEARPRPAYSFDGNSQSTLAQTALYGQNFVVINAPFAVVAGNTIGVTLDADLGVVFLTVVLGSGAYSSAYSSAYQIAISGGDFNPDFGPDFSTGSYVGLYISPPLIGQASSGAWVANWSSPQILAQNYPGSASGAGGGDG